MSRIYSAILVFATITLALTIPNTDGASTPVNLATAGNYVIFGQSGITTTGTTAIVGDIGISPAAATAVTGFALTVSTDGTYSTSSLVTGKIYAPTYKSPTPATLTAATNDLTTAYNDAAGRPNPDKLNSGAGNINGVSLDEGLYKWTTALTLGGTVTLAGNPSSVFIFQIDGTLNFNSDANIVLSGGVVPANIFWQSAGAVTLAAGAQVQGTILGKTGIVFKSGAVLVGKALAQTAVTMISNKLTAA